MELVQELFVTACVALLFSFVVAKLVSIATGADDERDLGLKSTEAILEERVVEEAKFEGGLRVRSTRSKRKVRFAEESVRKVAEFEGFEDERYDSALISDSAGRIKVVGLSEKAAVDETGRAEVGRIKEEDAVTSLNGLAVKEGSERKEADDIASVIKETRAVNLDGLVMEGDSDGKKVDDIGSVSNEEDAVTNLDGLLVEEGCEKVDDIDSVIREEDAVNNWDELVVREGEEADDIKSAIKEVNTMTDLFSDQKTAQNANAGSTGVGGIKEEDAVINLDGLVVEKGSEGKKADDESVVREGNAMTTVSDEKIVETAEADDIVAQDAEVRNVECGIEQGLNKGDEKEEELVCDEDDDWEGIERSELDEVFAAAADYVAGVVKDDRLSNVGSDVQMQLYGLHKVAMEGPCHEPQPMALKVSSRAKWVDSCYV